MILRTKKAFIIAEHDEYGTPIPWTIPTKDGGRQEVGFDSEGDAEQYCDENHKFSLFVIKRSE